MSQRRENGVHEWWRPSGKTLTLTSCRETQFWLAEKVLMEKLPKDDQSIPMSIL
jgi:hypothetical protein